MTKQKRKEEFTINYRIDPHKLNKEIIRLNQSKNYELSQIVLQNISTNLLIKEEMYKYTSELNKEIIKSRDNLTNNINQNLCHLIISLTIIFLLFLICLRTLMIDISKLFKTSERKDAFIDILLNKISK